MADQRRGLQEGPLVHPRRWPLWSARLREDATPLLPDGNLGTFTIINGDSSVVSAEIHDGMPVWIDLSQLDAWLAAEPEDAMAMLLASKTSAMEAYLVSRAVNTEQLLRPAS
ncbi:SOS response-associated peptidase family protein [Stenotrophomonas sp. 57]|uniref:SOS response-associated peptidase family protein n=1 Tax=Stenotrophomonas sp. 57 TaxID=3051119 RepID=UPI00256EDB9C|nr:SOS response-associated peptidase family protein [Stenotrophomonas sp. 57]